jgi:outer membrane biosynthesis protein TonB
MRKSDRIYALIGALLLHLVLLLVLIFTFLRYPPADATEWPPTPENEIVLDEVEPLYASGEFVKTGDNLEEMTPPDTPAPSTETITEPTQDAADLTNAGKAAEPKKIVTSEKASPAKVEKKQTGPTKEELAAEKARQEAKKQEQAKKNITDATKKAFGGGASGKSTSGSVEGNSTSTGATTGTPGNGLKGRTMESWGTVGSTKLGVIAIRVKVNAAGAVTEASYDASASSGPVAADASMRQSCIARSRQCRFSVLEDSPVQSGTITWVFK